MRKFLFVSLLSILFSAFVVAPFVCAHYTNQGIAKIRENEEQMRKVMPKFIADLKAIDANPPFPNWSRERNAEPFLSLWVSWEGKDIEKQNTPTHQALREMFEKYPKAFNDEAQFLALAEDPLVKKIDTRWMDNLLNFDHWRMTSYPKVQEQLREVKNLNSIARIGVMITLPIPNFMELRQFALVHLIKKHKQGKALEGLTVFRKVAELSHTTGSLVGEMVAVAILKAEITWVTLTKAYEWPIVDPDRVNAFQRVSWTWAGYLTAPWLAGFPRELEPFLKPQTGLCGAVGESNTGVHGLSDFLEPQFPFEMDFSDSLAKSRKLSSKTQEICGLQDFSPLMDRAPAAANPLISKDSPGLYTLVSGEERPGMFFNPARIPYARRTVAVMLMTIARPSYMKFYSEEER